MTLPSSYKTGTITVAAGGTKATGSGTNFTGYGVQAGDILWAGGMDVAVASVESATALTLAFPWSGAALNGAPYEIRFTSDSTRVLVASRDAIQSIEDFRGDLYASAAVYATVAAGIAAVKAGEQFQVRSGAEMIRYRRDANGTATELARYATAEKVTSEADRAVAAAGTAAAGVRDAVKSDADRAAASAAAVPVLDERTAGIQRLYDDRGYVFGITSPSDDLMFAVTDTGRTQSLGGDVATVTELEAAVASLNPRLLAEAYEPLDRPLIAAIATESGALLTGVDANGVGVVGAAPLGCLPVTQLTGSVSHISLINYAHDLRRITDGAGEREAHWWGPRLRFLQASAVGVEAVRVLGPDWGRESYDSVKYPKIAIVVGMGQSLMAGVSNLGGSISATPAFAPARAVMFGEGSFAPLMDEGGVADDLSRMLVPASTTTRELPTHQVSMMLTANGLAADEGLFVTNNSRGGYNIGQLVKDGSTAIYARWLARLESFALWAAVRRVQISRVIMYWQQGQSGGVPGGLEGEQQYYNLMMQLWSDIAADVRLRAGSPVPALIVIAPLTHKSVGAGWHPKNPFNLGITGAHYRLGFEQATKFALAGPDYYIARQDGTHMMSAGYAIIGGHMARATKKWTESGGAWRPLHCTGGVRSGATVTLTFSGGVGPMVFDSYDPAQGPVLQGFRALPNRGLLWFQDGGTPVDIQAVQITGNRQITVTLTGDPGAGVAGWISIGVGPFEGTNEGFINLDPTTGTGGGTNIRTESGDVNTLGHALNDWACQQVVKLS